MSVDVDEAQSKEKVIDKDLLLSRFKSSKIYTNLSEDDRAVLLDAIADDDEIAIKQIDTLLTQEELLKEYFYQQTELITDELTGIAVMTFERTNQINKLHEAESPQIEADSKTADDLLN